MSNTPIASTTTIAETTDMGRAAILSALCGAARHAYVPRVNRIDGPDQGSRYFGRPWLPKDMPWPRVDGRPLDFVLQINTEELPEGWNNFTQGPKLVLFFFSPDLNENVVLAVDLKSPGGLVDLPQGLKGNDAVSIENWQPIVDYPWTEDFEAVFNELSDDIYALTEDMDCFEFGKMRSKNGQDYHEKDAIELGIETHYHCYQCDKLGGWPAWAQGNDTPLDKTGTPMKMFMQVVYGGLLLGDIPEKVKYPTWGTGHIFYSSTTGEFTYVWACD